MNPPSLDAVRTAFPQLEILELIGRGGMGFAYAARQPHLDRVVALKLLPIPPDADPTFAERFAREGRLLARLNHPNIVVVHEFGQAAGFAFLLMEWVDGVNLRQAMRSGRFSPAAAVFQPSRSVAGVHRPSAHFSTHRRSGPVLDAPAATFRKRQRAGRTP